MSYKYSEDDKTQLKSSLSLLHFSQIIHQEMVNFPALKTLSLIFFVLLRIQPRRCPPAPQARTPPPLRVRLHLLRLAAVPASAPLLPRSNLPSARHASAAASCLVTLFTLPPTARPTTTTRRPYSRSLMLFANPPTCSTKPSSTANIL